MRTLTRIATAVALAAGLALTTSVPAHAAAVTPVPRVDVQKYLGTWKQIADIPQWYEAFCVRDVTANYSLNADGTVRVVNTCTGPVKNTIRTNGTARVLDRSTNAQLQVSFLNLFGKPFYPDAEPNYVIIGLAPDYSWAVVGHPERTSAYILSRTPALTGQKLTDARAVLVANGYDPCDLKLTKQTGGGNSTAPLC